jgi:hypothetical protein
LEDLVVVSAARLQGIPSRSTPPRVAAELARLNDAVRDAARHMITAFDQPADFTATLLRNADV